MASRIRNALEAISRRKEGKPSRVVRKEEEGRVVPRCWISRWPCKDRAYRGTMPRCHISIESLFNPYCLVKVWWLKQTDLQLIFKHRTLLPRFEITSLSLTLRWYHGEGGNVAFSETGPSTPSNQVNRMWLNKNDRKESQRREDDDGTFHILSSLSSTLNYLLSLFIQAFFFTESVRINN